MSFLHTLATLAQHAVHAAEGNSPGNAVQQSQPQAQAPIQSPTGMTNLGGTQAYAPQPQGTQSLLQSLALQSQHSPLNLGSPDYQSDPQGGFGMQVQNIGGAQQQLQAPYSPWQNMTGHPINYVNPQVQDNGYSWYQ